jgi:hypothetical protein
MANLNAEPPSTSSNGLRYLVGQNRHGQWVVRDTRGLSGGLFISQREAKRYALLETGNHPENVILVSDPIDLDFAGL